ncbi:MAG TPA: sialidase family protein [Streptosporangiaceae bacterium]|nr:sialidase family protein [Streptosporangiaceae bacterium]
MAGGITTFVVAAGIVAVTLLHQNPAASSGVFSGHDAAYVGQDVHSVLIDPSNPARIFVGGHASAIVSTDAGRTLQQVGGLQNVDAMSWLSSPGGQQQVVAGHYGVRTSSDDGLSWQDITANLPGSDVHAAGMDPATPGHLFSYIVGMGVFASTDGGHSWSPVGGQDLSLMGPMIVSAGGQHVVASDMQAGIVASADGGHTWKPTGANVQAFWISADPADAKHLLAVGSLLYESTDSGITWSPRGILPQGVRAVAIAPGPNGSWYAGKWANDDAQILVSTDRGASWQAVSASP